MIGTVAGIDIDRISLALYERARMQGRVPVAWLWGEDVRAAHSEWLDSGMAKMIMIHDPTLTLPDDGRICVYCGLPAYPMACDGIALKTVAEQESGFD